MGIQFQTPISPNSRPSIALPWVSKMLQNPIEATSQSEFIKTCISTHQNSSPASILSAIDHITKGAKAIMHRVALLEAEVVSLRKANKGLSKHYRAKKAYVRLGGSLTIQEAEDLLDQKAADEQILQENRQSGSREGGARTKKRCCSVCGKPGHNARTCQEAAESSDSSISSVIVVD